MTNVAKDEMGKMEVSYFDSPFEVALAFFNSDDAFSFLVERIHIHSTFLKTYLRVLGETEAETRSHFPLPSSGFPYFGEFSSSFFLIQGLFIYLLSFLLLMHDLLPSLH